MDKFTKEEYITELRKIYKIACDQKDGYLMSSTLQSLSIMSGVGSEEIRQQIRSESIRMK